MSLAGTPQLTSARQARALQKAIDLRWAGRVERVQDGTYHVPSTTREQLVHTVTVQDGATYRCTCEAGTAGHPCVHAAAVYLRKVEAASRGKARVSGVAAHITVPAAPVAPAAPSVRMASRRVAL